MSGIYLGLWSCADDVFASFQVANEKWPEETTSYPPADTSGIEILVAWYGNEDYEGSAHVLYREAGVLYEITCSHCSCRKLEGLWEPERVEPEEYIARMRRDVWDGSGPDPREYAARVVDVLR